MAFSSKTTFKNGEKARLNMSHESGVIVGVATYRDRPPLYLLRYVNAQGQQTETWVTGGEIEAV